MDRTSLQSARLTLSPLSRDDLDACAAIDADPQVTRYLGPGTASRRREWMAARLEEGWPQGGGWWGVRVRGESELLGWCALFPFPRSIWHVPQTYDLGYRYLPRTWGRGIATEAAARVRDHAFAAMGHDRVVGITHPGNHASQRVLCKIGLRREGEALHRDMLVPFFSLTRRTWQSLAGGKSG